MGMVWQVKLFFFFFNLQHRNKESVGETMQVPTWSGSGLPARTRGDASAKGKRLNPIVVVAAPGGGGGGGGVLSDETEASAQGQAKTLPSLPFQHHQIARLKGELAHSPRLHCGCQVTGPH